jgi:hypothetical protein
MKMTKKDLTERLEWLLEKLEENQMQSEIVWFIYNNYRNKFLKEKK